MKDSPIQITIKKQALDYTSAIAEALDVNAVEIIGRSLHLFDNVTKQIIDHETDVCYADGSKAHSYGNAVRAIQRGEPYEILEGHVASANAGDIDANIDPEVQEYLARISNRLNISKSNVLDHAARFYHSFVSASKKGFDVGYTDSETHKFMSYTGRINEELLAKKEKEDQRLEHIPDVSQLSAMTANYDEPPNRKNSESYETFHFSPEMYEHLEALASELEIKPEEVIDGALYLYKQLADDVARGESVGYLDAKEHHVCMQTRYMSEYEPVYIQRTPKDMPKEKMAILEVDGTCVEDLQTLHEQSKLEKAEITHRAIDFFTEVVRAKEQEFALTSWNAEQNFGADYVEMLDEWLIGLHVAKNPELAQDALDAAAAAESQYIEDFIEYATQELQANVSPEFGSQLAGYLDERPYALAGSSETATDEMFIQAFLEARIIKQQYLQHVGQGRQWNDDYFNGIAATAQEHIEAEFGGLIDELLAEIDSGATPKELVAYAKHERATLPTKALLRSVPSDKPNNGEHQGMIESQYIAIA